MATPQFNLSQADPGQADRGRLGLPTRQPGAQLLSEMQKLPGLRNSGFPAPSSCPPSHRKFTPTYIHREYQPTVRTRSHHFLLAPPRRKRDEKRVARIASGHVRFRAAGWDRTGQGNIMRLLLLLLLTATRLSTSRSVPSLLLFLTLFLEPGSQSGNVTMTCMNQSCALYPLRNSQRLDSRLRHTRHDARS